MSASLQLTDNGRYLLALALAGENLNFTKLAIGSGDEPNSVDSLTDLVSKEIELEIEKYTVGTNCVTLQGTFSNTGVETGFNWTETGVYASDENGDEVLYAYANEGSEYSYIPAEIDGKLLSVNLSLVAAVDDAENITVSIGSNGTFATVEELNELQDDFNSHTHMLSEDDIEGILPIEKGGTNASTAENARTNLGLGTAAVKDYSTSVASGDTNLPTSEAVYSAINDTADNYLPLSGGTMSGSINMGGKTLSNVSTITNVYEQSLKINAGEAQLIIEADSGVDFYGADITNAKSLEFVNTYEPTGDFQAATKQYVDDKVDASKVTVDSALSDTSENPVQNKVINSALAEYLPLSGDTMTGTIGFSETTADAPALLIDDGKIYSNGGTMQIAADSTLKLSAGTDISIAGTDINLNGSMTISGEGNGLSIADGDLTVNGKIDNGEIKIYGNVIYATEISVKSEATGEVSGTFTVGELTANSIAINDDDYTPSSYMDVATKKYVDESVDDITASSINVTNLNIAYAECDTEASTEYKEITIENFAYGNASQIIAVYFKNGSTSSVNFLNISDGNNTYRYTLLTSNNAVWTSSSGVVCLLLLVSTINNAGQAYVISS